MVNTYRLLYQRFGEEATYDLDEATDVLVENYQVSSSGAVGQEAAERSFNEDRSRDSLYNQLKMYSELYRLLGWMHPQDKKLEFRNTILGHYVTEVDDPSILSAILRECLIGISFPNPNSENKGIQQLRFFPLLLKFMSRLDGYAHRDEIIVGLYTISDDTRPGVLEQKVDEVLSMRRSKEERQDAIAEVASDNGVQPNTLHNYTRFPLGVVKSDLVNWADTSRLKDVYENSTKFYFLTEVGKKQLRQFEEGIDIRNKHLENLSSRSRAYLVNVGFSAMLWRAGYEVVADDLMALKGMIGEFPGAKGLIGDTDLKKVYFSPYQQASHDSIRQGEVMFEDRISSE